MLNDEMKLNVKADPNSTDELERGYQEMAADLETEAEALEWAEGCLACLIEDGEFNFPWTVTK